MGLERARRTRDEREIPTEADLTALYAASYPRMVRLAAYLLGSGLYAEDVVQDAFVRMTSARLRDPDKALPYLRQAVVNACRGAMRHRLVAHRHAQTLHPVDHAPSAEEAAWTAFDRSELVWALRALPPRKRQVVVLRHYCDLSEATVAEMLGISIGAVKSLASRALSDLATALERRDD